MQDMNVISLGAGVQSSTMALMAACGELKPMPDCAVFADTQDEPKAVYEWLDWLEKQLPYPVLRVSTGNLMQQALHLRLSKKSGNTYLAIGLPVYTVDVNGSKGMGMRQCTRTFKIDPIRRELRKLRNGRLVTQWIGISFDELERMKAARDKWCTNIWPLVDAGMTRADCLEWMQDKGFPEPPRSACKKCPFHSDSEWLRLKEQAPNEFAEAVEFERLLQRGYATATALRATPFLHDSRKPLAEVDFKILPAQPSLFRRECEGMCGV